MLDLMIGNLLNDKHFHTFSKRPIEVKPSAIVRATAQDLAEDRKFNSKITSRLNRYDLPPYSDGEYLGGYCVINDPGCDDVVAVQYTEIDAFKPWRNANLDYEITQIRGAIESALTMGDPQDSADSYTIYVGNPSPTPYTLRVSLRGNATRMYLSRGCGKTGNITNTDYVIKFPGNDGKFFNQYTFSMCAAPIPLPNGGVATFRVETDTYYKPGGGGWIHRFTKK